MTIFLRLLAANDKAISLKAVCAEIRRGDICPGLFEVIPASFHLVPGAPFSYWVSESVRSIFHQLSPFDAEDQGRATRCGLGTLDDFRFIRLFWENPSPAMRWRPYFSGGRFSPFYDSFALQVFWPESGRAIKAFVTQKVGSASRKVQGEDRYFQKGFVFPRRTKAFSPKFMPPGGIFSTAGQAGFCAESDLPWTVALMTSQAVNHLVSLSQGGGGAPQFEVGLIKRLPWPQINDFKQHLSSRACRAWSLKRTLDSIEETSHAFSLPAALRERLGGYDPVTIASELAEIQTEIDAIAFDLYDFSEADRQAAMSQTGADPAAEDEATDDDAEEVEVDAPPVDGLLSWAIGVAFGRFDWRLATGERDAPSETGPLEPLPTRSFGMLREDAEPFHAHAGVQVDDQGHAHDLARLVEEVLVRVDVPVPEDVRHWLKRDFFAFHLQRYSKSRRKAPIYWPLSTTSSSYTLWVYYPHLSSQTLYTAINDFIEPKLKQVGTDVAALRNKGSARTRDDEKQFEALQAFELELIELRDILLKLAPTYKPNHDDGVQITAAPLWLLFRHKPWQKVLKDTWAKLEKGDYDWTHLAMNYWPERVREKCKTDKSLAIAHGLEDLYIEPKAKPKKTRARKGKEA